VANKITIVLQDDGREDTIGIDVKLDPVIGEQPEYMLNALQAMLKSLTVTTTQIIEGLEKDGN
jgi:hypothetical protein